MYIMDLKKNMIGIIANILLVILLSQPKYFNFLTHDALGRAVLILFILGISYTSKIAGVVAVLAIIIMFNQHGTEFMEGFTSSTKSNSDEVLKMSKALSAKEKKPDTVLPSSVAASREGFNLIEKEHSMLKGKRPNEIPVLPSARTQSEDVEPAEKETFSLYTAF